MHHIPLPAHQNETDLFTPWNGRLVFNIVISTTVLDRAEQKIPVFCCDPSRGSFHGCVWGESGYEELLFDFIDKIKHLYFICMDYN